MLNSDSPAISINGVWKIFGNKAEVALADIRQNNLGKAEILNRHNCVVGVADVTFDVLPGEIFCVMGLSGSGKSTLVRHINRLLEPTAGSIHVNGKDVMALSQSDLREYRNKQIAMVFQNFALMPHRSVLDNIAMPLDIRGFNKNQRLEIAQKNLEMVELTGWGNKFAHELSGGMQQRVGLARALASDPEVLLMDEPFSALDPLIRREMQEQLVELQAELGKTIVFITHDLNEAMFLGDRIAVMRDGRIVQIGTPEDILTDPANDYVAQFVQDVDRTRVLTAASVMEPPAAAVPVTMGPRGALKTMRDMQISGLLVTGPADGSTLARVSRWCEEHDVLPESLSLGTRSLEDVFLELTGRELSA